MTIRQVMHKSKVLCELQKIRNKVEEINKVFDEIMKDIKEMGGLISGIKETTSQIKLFVTYEKNKKDNAQSQAL